MVFSRSLRRPLRTTLALLAAAWPGASAVSLPFHLGPPLPARPAAAPVCGAPTDTLDLAVWRVYAADGRPDLSCDNAFVEYQRTPRGPQNPQGAFEQIAAQIREAHSEVLLTNMEWHAGPGHPGWSFAEAVRDLYARVKANPAAYPAGMSVQLALGGFPDLRRGDGGTYILNAVRDLRALGVPMNDPAAGWQLRVANYRYFPHSHVKMVVVDGLDVTTAGFNYTDWHLTRAEPGGHDLHDAGLRMRGPAAQDGVAVFDDLWRHSNQVRCPAGVGAAQVYARCVLGPPDEPRHPAPARQAQPAGHARAYLLYRRPGDDMADRAMQSLIASAKTEIDLTQADFSSTTNCWLAYAAAQDCGRETFPPYFSALLGAMERGVKVRVLTVNYGYGKVANRSGVALLRYEAKRSGLSDDIFDARYVNFDMHTKAMVVDHRMVEVGSMNFHFSSWGEAGLNEAVIATSDPEAAAQQEADFARVWAEQSAPVPPEPWLRYVRRVSPEDLTPPPPAPRELPEHPRRESGE